MQHSKITIISAFLLFFLLINKVSHAQEGYFVDKDKRIAKFQTEILKFLIVEKQFFGVQSSISFDKLKELMVVRKCLEVYSDSTNVNILLIRFKDSSDHGSRFWGILTNNEKFFFYDTKDVSFLDFKKRYSSSTISIVNFYCNKNKELW